MTQIGKCDTCRLRKVKCDEVKPKCTPCRKRDRPCTYSYGKASALVLEDPNQLSKHGKPRVAPLVYPLLSYDGSSSSASSSSSNLRLTTEREAEKGQGVFKTFTPITKEKFIKHRRPTAQQRRRLEEHLARLKSVYAVTRLQPSSSETNLVVRYIDMIGSIPLDLNPLAILGSWIESIPSRIGSNSALGLAAEYLVDSFALFWDKSFSRRSLARATKAKALKELQLAVDNTGAKANYDILLAMKLHYAAEVLNGMETLYHTIHANAISEILKLGIMEDIDEEHFWELLDNTYIDDVSEAMLAGRTSIYDNEIYLAMTYPPNVESSSLPLIRRVMMLMMHSSIQMPRLVCLIRHSIRNPEDTETLASAVCLAESIWQLDPFDVIQELFHVAVTVVPTPPTPDIKDLVPETYHFSSIQSMILLTRYWMLLSLLGGLTLSLYHHFPAQATASWLPRPSVVQKRELDASTDIIRSLSWSFSINRSLPLVPLRIHTPLQIAIGPWHRAIQRLSPERHLQSAPPYSDVDIEISRELTNAQRMLAWIVEQVNRIHDIWRVQRMDVEPVKAALDALSGEKIPEWLPVRVRFENEGDNMVMKLDYDLPTPLQRQHMYFDDDESWTRSTSSASPFGPQDRRRWDRSMIQELPLTPAKSASTHKEAESDASPVVITATPSNPYKNPCISPSWT